MPAIDSAKELFTKGELAQALAVKPSAAVAMVRRHRLALAASGNGKARLFPRATVEDLRDRLRSGTGPQTANHYLAHVKAFCRWLVKDRRMSDSPLAHLEAGTVRQDRRHDRRPLSIEELRSVIVAARLSPRAFRGLSGQERALLYAVACVSGFRAAELASLRPTAFDLAGDAATVTLAAEDAKNGRAAVQPLPGDLVLELQAFLAGKDMCKRVWNGSWAARAADMFRLDLEAVGIAYVIEGPDGPLHADFHCLRHAFVALLDKSGASLKEAMQLARHSDPKLTMAR